MFAGLSPCGSRINGGYVLVPRREFAEARARGSRGGRGVRTWACISDLAGWVRIGDVFVVQADFAQPLEVGEFSADSIQAHRLDLDGTPGGAEDDLLERSVRAGSVDVFSDEGRQE